MKITVDIPDEVIEEGRVINIFAGIELIAFKYPGKKWNVKVARCSMCGECCAIFAKDSNDPFFEIKDGTCQHLGYDGNLRICGLKLSRPYVCSIGKGYPRVSDCTERFEETE